MLFCAVVVSAILYTKCPLCSNQEVEQCLLKTALDLGASGPDEYFGSGLVQAAPAYLCLKNTAQCCQNADW
jgi:hypothetical protein